MRLKPGVPVMLVELVAVTLLMGFCFWMAGCSQSHNPTAPDQVKAVVVPVHEGADLLRSHNVPALGLDGHSVVWLCETKARYYPLPAGGGEWTFDHYIQEVPCPDVPVD